MAERIRCAVYTRKSSEEGLEQSFNSLHAQREACDAYVASQKHEGWQLIATPYDDGGFSGGSMERPGLKALMADVVAGLIDTVVVYKVDRLTRSLADFAKMVELFDEHQVSFVSVTQAFNTTTSMGRLTLNVLLSFAQFEREVTGERIRDKIAASKAKGMWMGGLVPLGYDVVDRQLVINPAEARQVVTLFDRYLGLGSVDMLAGEAAALGIVSKVRVTAGGKRSGGTALGRGSLYAILSNPVYVGKIGHKGQCYEGQHEGIVAPAVFDAVACLLSANRRKRRGRSGTAPTSMLSGLVETADGDRLTATHTQKGKRRYRYYAGGALRIPADDLETLAVDALCEHLRTPAKLATLLPDLASLNPAVLSAAATRADGLAALDERREAAEALISRITVDETQITISLDLTAVGTEGVGHLRIPATIGRTRSRLALVVPGQSAPRPDPALIALVAQARGWFTALTSGSARSIEQLAASSKVTPAYVRQLIGAAFLAPDLVTAIVEGRQPPTLTAARLRELLPLPAAWQDQRALLSALT